MTSDKGPEPQEARKQLNLRAMLWAVTPPLDFQILGRTLLHTALVGLAAGLVGAAFYASLELAQQVLLVGLAGFSPLRAHGEGIFAEHTPGPFRPWLVVLLPALGGLCAGLLTELAPEARGGGGDATIHSFHHQGGVIRKRVLWVKALASIFTLGSGGSGGREGPTMQIGGALGSTIGILLRVSLREQRILMVAGVAAGLAAVFRTPLGAALVAAEVLYRDDFEAEALVPAVLASVIAYSVVITLFGESVLFARAPRYPFVPAHLPLYALLALFIAALASIFLATLRSVQRRARASRLPGWARPAAGGLALGLFAVPLIIFIGGRIGTPGRALGILGGGYGAAQVAITGADWLPTGWTGVELLLFLCVAKLVASSLTIGSGGSAGDFGPSLVLGGLFGGAFGRAAALLLHDPRIDPGAFALVGMGTFYGGLAHVPLSALILVSELAGSYDLLVPAMLASGIGFVALRRRTLYPAQMPTRKDSPVHQGASAFDVLGPVRVGDVMTAKREFRCFAPGTPIGAVTAAVALGRGQATFPVLDEHGHLAGVIAASAVDGGSGGGAEGGTPGPDAIPLGRDGKPARLASDIMLPPVAVNPTESLRRAAELMLANTLKQIPILDTGGEILGFLEEADITRAYTAVSSGDGPASPKAA